MPAHAVRFGFLLLRMWLGPLILVLLINALVALPMLLTGWLRPVPYLVCALIGTVWWLHPRVARVSAACSSVMAGLLAMRAAEILFFAEDVYSARTRIVAASLWAFLGWGTLVVGWGASIFIGRNESDKYLGGAREWSR